MTTQQTTKNSKFKNWCAKHNVDSDDVIVYAFAAASFAAVVALAGLATKAAIDEEKKQNAWIDEQFSNGHSILSDEYGQLVSADIISIYH